VTAAVRLQQAAGDGHILVGPGAQRLLRGSVILTPIGGGAADRKSAPAWQVLEVVSRAPPIPRSLDAPMFGRQDELTRLRSAFRRAVRTGTVKRVTILGEAGLGKSRLAQELIASVGTAAYAITLRCPPYGYGPAFLPLRRAVIEAAGVLGWHALHDLLAADGTGLVRDMADVIGLHADAEGSDALFSAFRRLLEVLANERPLIVALEDLHWAEPTLLDLIDSLTREATGRILMVCIGRPELIERRPEWESNDRLDLEPLSAADLEGLVIERAGSIDSGTLSTILRLSQGNPLFAEQLVAAVDDGNVDAIPASLRGLLMMRLDQLGPGERDLLRCASIVGMEMEERELSALVPERAHPHFERHLDTLTRRRLIERMGSGMLRFRHVLIQIAAYQSMTLEDRARLHEHFGRWLEREAPRMSPDVAEILGHHLRMAVEHRRAGGRASAAMPGTTQEWPGRGTSDEPE
jgi:predicted ATPase